MPEIPARQLHHIQRANYITYCSLVVPTLSSIPLTAAATVIQPPTHESPPTPVCVSLMCHFLVCTSCPNTCYYYTTSTLLPPSPPPHDNITVPPRSIQIAHAHSKLSSDSAPSGSLWNTCNRTYYSSGYQTSAICKQKHAGRYTSCNELSIWHLLHDKSGCFPASEFLHQDSLYFCLARSQLQCQLWSVKSADV